MLPAVICFSHACLLHLSVSLLLAFFHLLVAPFIYLWCSLSQPNSQGKVKYRAANFYSNISPSPVIEHAKDEIIPAAVVQPNSSTKWLKVHSDFGVYTSLIDNVFGFSNLFLYDFSESLLIPSQISRLLPKLALSKKNTLDEFQAKVWQLFQFQLRLWEETNIKMNRALQNLYPKTNLFNSIII